MISHDDILPSSLRHDPNYQALNRLLDKAASLDITKEILYWLDHVEASVLPHLAQQFHVLGLEGWEFANTDREKRELLKRAVKLHRFKGTPWAVRQGIKNIDPALDIREWFEYDGTPYCFRLENGTVLSLATAVKLFWTIESLKSFRSKLENDIIAQEERASVLHFASEVFSYVTSCMEMRSLSNSVSPLFVGKVTGNSVSKTPVHLSPYVSSGKIFVCPLNAISIKFETSEVS